MRQVDKWTVKRLLQLALGALCVLTAVTAATAQESAPTWTFLMGERALFDVDGARTAKAFEYRDPHVGPFVGAFGMNWVSPSNGWSLDLAGRNLIRDDQRWAMDLWRPGQVRVRGSWVETPRFYSTGSTMLLSGTGGDYTLANPLRQSLEDAATSAPSTIATLMPDVLEASGNSVDLGVKRRQAEVAATVTAARGFDLTLNGGQQRKVGNRVIGTGTYLRRQAVAGDAESGANFFDRERFEPRGLELPEPIDYRANDYGVSATVRRKAGFVTLGWQTSQFDNKVSSLLWDNPFEGGASVASASDKGRFAQGGLDLAPSNEFNRLQASGGANLPGRTRLNVTFARAITEQNDPFMAFTRNEAMYFPGADRVLGNADDVLATDLSLLPAASLSGEVHTTRADVRVSSHPSTKLALRGAYRSYKYDNQTPELFFPGYAAYSESYYRAGVGQRIAGRDTLYNHVAGYDRTTYTAGVGYRLSRRAAVDADFIHTTMDYDARQVESTGEDTWKLGLRLDPSDLIAARVGYLTGTREYDGNYNVGLEASRVRAFDVWDRDRARWNAEVDVTPGDRWTFGVAYQSSEDDFPGAVTAPDPLPASGNIYESYAYGLNASKSNSISLMAGYQLKAFDFIVSAGHDTDDWESMAVTKTTLANDAVQYDPANRWSRKQHDAVDWGSLGITAHASDNVQVMADMTWSIYTGQMETTNLGTPNVNSAQAYDMPDFTSDLFVGKLSVKWAVRSNLDLYATYWYEPYRLTDWQTDNTKPYLQGVVTETGDNATQIRDEEVSRYLSMDSRYSGYTINAATVAMSMRF